MGWEGGCPVHWRIFTSISDFPICDNKKCLKTLLNVSQLRTAALEVTIFISLFVSSVLLYKFKHIGIHTLIFSSLLLKVAYYVHFATPYSLYLMLFYLFLSFLTSVFRRKYIDSSSFFINSCTVFHSLFNLLLMCFWVVLLLCYYKHYWNISAQLLFCRVMGLSLEETVRVWMLDQREIIYTAFGILSNSPPGKFNHFYFHLQCTRVPV